MQTLQRNSGAAGSVRDARRGGRVAVAALWLGAITLLGLGLRVWAIGAKGLWLDEAFSIWMSRHPLPELLDWLVRIDQHPPLYYALLHGWLAFGDSEAWVRALSALAGTLTIPVFFAFVRTLSADLPALIAAFVLTIAPFHVRFAQEARMYALLTLAAAVTFLCVAIILTPATPANRARQRAGWIGYVLATVATLLTHNTALFLPIAVNLFMAPFIFVRRRRADGAGSRTTAPFARLQAPPLRGWLLAQAAVIVLWLPWSAAFVQQSIGVYAQFWIQPPTVQTVFDTLTTFASAFLPGNVLWPAVVWTFFGALLLLGLVALRRSPALLALLLVLWLTPFAGEWLVSLRRPIFYDRTLIWASLPLYTIAAFGIAALRRPWLRAAVLVALLGIQSFSLHSYYNYFEKENWRGAAAYLAERYEAGDLLLFNATWVQIPFDYYFRAYYPEAERRGAPVDLFDGGVLEPKMTAADVPRLAELIGNRDRVWLIYSHDWYTDPQKLIPAALNKQLSLLDQQAFYGLELRLYAESPE
ncbi:MAG: glycosyltransferase family 39 protein [Caldilineaceae bacterium]|nr:glycosyltransferase family 39 protein [Caldilineaceae bacterium]